MDILNFISWIKGSRVVTSVNASQTLLPVGLKDPKRDDGYLAGAISVADFASAIVPTYTNCNIPIGENTLTNLTSGQYNIAIGCESLKFTTNGSNNVAIGASTLQNSTTGENNTAVGYQALLNNSTGIYNTFVGILAGTGITTGSNNVGLGWKTLSNGPNGTGQNNIGIGQVAGENVGAANYSIAIGSGTQINGHSCSIVLGQNASATASNQLVIGSSFVGENIGTIATEPLVPTKSWTVKINGVNYKIALQVA